MMSRAYSKAHVQSNTYEPVINCDTNFSRPFLFSKNTFLVCIQPCKMNDVYLNGYQNNSGDLNFSIVWFVCLIFFIVISISHGTFYDEYHRPTSHHSYETPLGGTKHEYIFLKKPSKLEKNLDMPQQRLHDSINRNIWMKPMIKWKTQ